MMGDESPASGYVLPKSREIDLVAGRLFSETGIDMKADKTVRFHCPGRFDPLRDRHFPVRRTCQLKLKARFLLRLLSDQEGHIQGQVLLTQFIRNHAGILSPVRRID